VARIYRDLASTLVVDEADASLAADVEKEGLRCVVTPTVMSDRARTVALANTAVREALRK
jgi:LPPG:FO 2-phospho-L-lactate transferase